MRDSLSWTQIRSNLSQLSHLKVEKAEAYGERGVNGGPSDFLCGSFALYPVALSHYPSLRGQGCHADPNPACTQLGGDTIPKDK